MAADATPYEPARNALGSVLAIVGVLSGLLVVAWVASSVGVPTNDCVNRNSAGALDYLRTVLPAHALALGACGAALTFAHRWRVGPGRGSVWLFVGAAAVGVALLLSQTVGGEAPVELPGALVLFGVWMTSLGHPLWVFWGAVAALGASIPFAVRRSEESDPTFVAGLAAAVGAWAVLSHAADTVGAVSPICLS